MSPRPEPPRARSDCRVPLQGPTLTSPSWSRAGWRGWPSAPCPDSPRCRCCRCTWPGRSPRTSCRAGHVPPPFVLGGKQRGLQRAGTAGWHLPKEGILVARSYGFSRSRPHTKGTQPRVHGFTPPCHSDRVRVSPWCPHTRAGARGTQLSPGSGDGLNPRGRLCDPIRVPAPVPAASPNPSPEQLNSFFWISATLRPRSWAGAAHWVKSPMVGRWRSHCDSQARWQSQKRWLECRRLRADGGSAAVGCPLPTTPSSGGPNFPDPKATGTRRGCRGSHGEPEGTSPRCRGHFAWGTAGVSPPTPPSPPAPPAPPLTRSAAWACG